MIESCAATELIAYLLELMRQDCTGDMNPYCRELIAQLEFYREIGG